MGNTAQDKVSTLRMHELALTSVGRHSRTLVWVRSACRQGSAQPCACREGSAQRTHAKVGCTGDTTRVSTTCACCALKATHMQEGAEGQHNPRVQSQELCNTKPRRISRW
jgi:hypothetical protein